MFLWGTIIQRSMKRYKLTPDLVAMGKGFMIAIELNGTDDQLAAKIHDQLFDRGYLASLRRGHNTLRIDPPLNIAEEILDNFLTELSNILRDLT